MKNLPTKVRLTLYYALMLAVGLTIFAATLRIVTGAALLHSLDSSLLAATQLVQVDTETGVPNFAQQQDAPILKTGLISLVLRDHQGSPTGHMGATVAKLPVAKRTGYSTLDGWRIYSRTVPNGTMQAYRSLNELQNTLSTMNGLLLAGVPLMVLLASAGGWWLARQALAPITTVMTTASAIAASGDPTRRVPRRPGNDDMGRLVDLVNAMLQRLENVIRRERTFANAAAHQLRTPITIIQGRTELALEQPRTPDAYQATLSTIRDQTEEMHTMVDSLLALARASHATLRPTALAPILTDALETAETSIQAKGLNLRADLDDATVHADPTLLRQAVLALLDNATKFTQAPGTVVLDARRSGPTIRITVEDSGPGIDATERQRLIQPFQRGTTDQPIEGTGLGLALAHDVIEAHHGTLTLEDSEHGGLRAEIELPAA